MAHIEITSATDPGRRALVWSDGEGLRLSIESPPRSTGIWLDVAARRELIEALTAALPTEA